MRKLNLHNIDSDAGFDAMMRVARPRIEAPADFKDELLQELKARGRKPRRRHRFMTAAAVLFCMMTLIGSESDLVSNPFEAFLVRTEDNGYVVFEDAFTGTRAGVPAHIAAKGNAAQIAFVTTTLEELAAQPTKALRITGIEIQSVRVFDKRFYGYQDGKRTTNCNFIGCSRSQIDAFYWKFQDEYRDLARAVDRDPDAAAANGLVEPFGTERFTYEGIDYMLRRWETTVPGWGQVIFFDTGNLE